LTAVGNHPLWAGRIDYDVEVALSGEAVKMTVPEARPEPKVFAAFVKIDRFETCLRRWRFGKQGQYQVRLVSGTRSNFRIVVKQGEREFTMITPAR
jgi:hypothetical protein